MTPTIDVQSGQRNSGPSDPTTDAPKRPAGDSNSALESLITCHVLDAALAKPAKGIIVGLQRHRKMSEDGAAFAFDPVAYGTTDDDGNCMDLLAPSTESSRELAILRKGVYKITFQTKAYFEATNRDCFYPWVEIPFEVHDTFKHHHIQLNISSHSFTTL